MLVMFGMDIVLHAFNCQPILYHRLLFQIPNLEGRAGMAAIVDEHSNLNLAELAAGVCKVLAPYARPQFVRLLPRMDMTGTFKLKKLDLQKEGFDPTAVRDRLYYLTAKGAYEPLTADAYGRICCGDIRL